MESFPTHIEVRRSARRKRTIGGRVEDDRVIVMVPQRLSAAAERQAVDSMVEKLRKQFLRKQARSEMSEDELLHLLRQLDRRYCGGRAQPREASWARTPRGRWGSCVVAEKRILLHPMLLTMPRYVLEYVAVHELCHITTPGGHTPEFWRAVAAYPAVERAKGYLEAAARYGVASGAGDFEDPANPVNSEGTADPTATTGDVTD